MQLYRFSPLKSQESFISTIKYVAQQTSHLSEEIIGKKLPINSLTIFAHYEEEFTYLTSLLNKMGNFHNNNNGDRVKLHDPIQIEENIIEFVRVRKPDPYRMHVGCNDFQVEDYSEFKEDVIPNKNLRVIKRKEYEMIEFFHPDYDVLAYVVSTDF